MANFDDVGSILEKFIEIQIGINEGLLDQIKIIEERITKLEQLINKIP